jgi:hypothetical protein
MELPALGYKTQPATVQDFIASADCSYPEQTRFKASDRNDRAKARSKNDFGAEMWKGNTFRPAPSTLAK